MEDALPCGAWALWGKAGGWEGASPKGETTMRSWWKRLRLMAGSLAFLGGMLSSAQGQFPSAPGGGGYGMPPGGMVSMPPSGYGMPPGAGPGMAGGGMPPGAFGGNPSMMSVPPDFPNPAKASPEPVSPFSIKDEGMPNAFSSLVDPRSNRTAPYNVAFRFEYLNWTITQAPLSTTAGDTSLDYSRMTGGRLTMGLAIGYIPPIEFSGFDFNRRTAVPNLGVAPGAIIPGGDGGTAGAVSHLSLWGIETNMFFNCADAQFFKIDFLMGYRHLDLYESLDITRTVVRGRISSTSAVGTFPGRDAFDGGQIGVRTVFTVSRVSIFADVKLGMGSTYHSVVGSASVPDRTFSLVPESTITASFQMTPYFRFFGGYGIMGWSHVARPGDNLGGNTSFSTHNFWANGFNGGIEIAF
jgi:Putative beta barrel porin-7 (BBP7)